MSRRRFFAPPSAFNRQEIQLSGDEARHLRSVLRLKPGDEVNVFDGEGKEFRCNVAGMGRDSVLLDECVEVAPQKPESPLNLTLAVALLKGEKFDLVVQKATELGVTRIVPVTTRHADIHLRDTSDAEKRVLRWRRIALEASKQSGRAVVPHISEPLSFASFIEEHKDTLQIMFSERDGVSLKELPTVSEPNGVTALVGSEGGWASDEIEKAHNSGFRIVTMGGRILRAETASIAVVVLLQHLYGDLN